MIAPALIELYERLYEAALAYPEAHEDHPWGHPALKVRKKAFLFLSNLDDDYISFSMKLPASSQRALELACANPTGYGLGKHGWVSFKLTDPTQIDPEDVIAWLDESYRAIAPKTLVKKLDPTD